MTPTENTVLFDRLLAALPQTQCTRCGYPDCAAYASAIVAQDAPVNQCPPGGDQGVLRLAAISGSPALPLNPANGIEGPRSVAVIDEAWCIGCTLCLEVCPTDAILGGNKMMHTVIEPYCTGCELCLPVCPVDCISLENVSGELTGWAAWSQASAELASGRYALHQTRQLKEKQTISAVASRQTSLAPGPVIETAPDSSSASMKKAVIDAALARARAQHPG